MTVKELMKQLQNLPSGADVYWNPNADNLHLQRVCGSSFAYTPRHRSGMFHLMGEEDISFDVQKFSSSKIVAVLF